MQQRVHLEIILLSFVMFMYGSHQIALYEAGQAQDWFLGFAVSTLGMIGFTNSILSIYQVVTKQLNNVTTQEEMQKTSEVKN